MENIILVSVLALVSGIAGGYFLRMNVLNKREKELEAEQKRIKEQSEAKVKEMVLEAKNESFRIREEAKREEQTKRRALMVQEERLMKKEEGLDKKLEESEKTKEDLEKKVAAVRQLKTDVEEIYVKERAQLENISGLSKESAREILLKKVEEESQEEILKQIKKVEYDMEEEARDRAKNIIAEAIQKYAAETAQEATATIVTLPNDEMKGRIIGREGRNINTFEEITGIDVIVDDTPGSIVISGFDLVRRYIAKTALEKLVADGRIHPARIEETVTKTKEEVNRLIQEWGEKAVFDTGVAGLHPNLVKLLGRLKFRVSFGQNVLKHSMEVSFLAASLASELGADVNVCRRAGLLHDIGKAVDHEIQGNHAMIGRDILRKFGLPQEVVHAVEAHHGDPAPDTIEAKIVQAANMISNARPGADKDNLDNYIKRLEELENVAKSFDGVRRVCAIQAGREVRVFIEPSKLTDLEAVKLAREISRKIEHDLQYPGQIKIEVVREMRVEEFAT
ncbi:ribonuclease Y [Candidatus Peregrinibacteria bacterium]|nr:ribonuclease Y [Candidatus Peregrinibacteria bacterium]